MTPLVNAAATLMLIRSVSIAAICGFALCHAASAATFYVSPNGSDANPGTSDHSAWKTIDKVNATTFHAGDAILFLGGRTFSGNLWFQAASTGTAANPIVVSTYGTGRATIQAGAQTGLYCQDNGGFAISNLVLQGSGAGSNTGHGICFYSTLAARQPSIQISNCDSSGFGQDGIVVEGWGSDTAGYDGVTITGCACHRNLNGILTFGQAVGALRNVTVQNCNAYSNPGSASYSVSGSGIVLAQVDGGSIRDCVAHDNGNPGYGGVGIWTWDSNNIVIADDESYHNKSAANDGDGFDFDGGVTNSVMERNYSHDNKGGGLCLFEYDGAAPNTGNTFRYNISQNDGSGIPIWNGGSGRLADNTFYGNTIYNSNAKPAVWYISGSVGATSFYNNIFMNTGQTILSIPEGEADLTFQGNDYWTSGGPFRLVYLGASYGSVKSWQGATGQEKLNGKGVGTSVDPRLQAPGDGGTVGDPSKLPTLTAYQLQSGSLVLKAGVNLRAFGIDPGPSDFYGNPLTPGKAFSIGAYQ